MHCVCTILQAGLREKRAMFLRGLGQVSDIISAVPSKHRTTLQGAKIGLRGGVRFARTWAPKIPASAATRRTSSENRVDFSSLRLGPVLAEEWLKEFESHNDRLGFVLVPAHVHMRTHAQCGAIMLIITRRSFQTQANPFKP